MPNRYIPLIKWPVAATVALAPIAFAFWFPMSYWFDVRTIHVNDATVGQPVTMVVDREVKRQVTMTYNVTIHRWTGSGFAAYCRASGGPWEYRVGAAYPVPLTLAWWTEHEKSCASLPPGQYQMTTRWVKLSGGLPLPEKSVSITSNIFTAKP